MTRSVAIIGFGSRGLGVLERIVALAATDEHQITVHVIDPAGTGAGVHGTGQPDYLLLNTTCGQISMFPDRLSGGAQTAGHGPAPPAARPPRPDSPRSERGRRRLRPFRDGRHLLPDRRPRRPVPPRPGRPG